MILCFSLKIGRQQVLNLECQERQRATVRSFLTELQEKRAPIHYKNRTPARRDFTIDFGDIPTESHFDALVIEMDRFGFEAIELEE